jgi:membrane protease subunit HflK
MSDTDNININIPKANPKQIRFFIILILSGLILSFSFYTVDANENAVILRLGKYYTTTGPGLHFKLPLIDKALKVKVDYQYKKEFGFRTIKSDTRSQFRHRGYENESWMLTGDLKIAEVKWVVQYKINDAKKYLFNVRNVESTIIDVSEAAMRLMIGDRSFTEALQSERVTIADKAKQYMQKLLDDYNAGISIQLVQLQGVVAPEPVADSFNEVNRAKQEQETLINVALQEFNKIIYKVEGDAQRMLTEAEGYAVERVNNALGDANLYESMLVEYSKYPQITKDRLYIEMMSIVLKNNKNKIIVDKDIENLVPFLDKTNIKFK